MMLNVLAEIMRDGVWPLYEVYRNPVGTFSSSAGHFFIMSITPMKLQFNLEEIKTTYFNYGPQFWTGKKCNVCRERFTLKNHSQKEIELILSEGWKVDEYHGSEGVKVKWYHKECFVRYINALKEIKTILEENKKSNEVSL